MDVRGNICAHQPPTHPVMSTMFSLDSGESRTEIACVHEALSSLSEGDPLCKTRQSFFTRVFLNKRNYPTSKHYELHGFSNKGPIQMRTSTILDVLKTNPIMNQHEMEIGGGASSMMAAVKCDLIIITLFIKSFHATVQEDMRQFKTIQLTLKSGSNLIMHLMKR